MSRLRDKQLARTHPPSIPVVKDQDLVIGRQSKIAFDSCADIQRCSEREQTVFGEPRAVVQASVREPLWSGVERVRP